MNEVWSTINILKTISEITKHFTSIGRYYRHSYGHLIVLLSEALSFDLKEYVDSISTYFLDNYRLLSLLSDKEEDKREVREFVLGL